MIKQSALVIILFVHVAPRHGVHIVGDHIRKRTHEIVQIGMFVYDFEELSSGERQVFVATFTVPDLLALLYGLLRKNAALCASVFAFQLADFYFFKEHHFIFA